MKQNYKESQHSASADSMKVALNAFGRVEKYLEHHFNFRYNNVSNEVEYRRKGSEIFSILNESDLYRELKLTGNSISQQDLRALLRSNFIQPYDPFLDYFESLPKWSDNHDYILQLASYVSADEQSAFNYHFKKMLVRTIACALEPDTFNKQAFILVGETHNTGKSSFCRFICPPALREFISESFSTDKDGQITLSENFLINLDELATLSKADLNHLKSMFSRDRVKVRHPYAAKPSVTPRRASFIGSTNNQEFLTDETGSVRWLCFSIKEIDFSYSSDINIDDVWAQAYSLYKSGFDYQLTRNDVQTNDLRNMAFQKRSPEMERISRFFLPGDRMNNDGFYQAFQFKDFIELNSDNKIKLNDANIGKALKQLGFTRQIKRTKEDSTPVYGYYYRRRIDFEFIDNNKEYLTTLTTDVSEGLLF